MTQAQILAKWLGMAKQAKEQIRNRDLAAFETVDALAVQIKLAQVFGLPCDEAADSPVDPGGDGRESAREGQ